MRPAEHRETFMRADDLAEALREMLPSRRSLHSARGCRSLITAMRKAGAPVLRRFRVRPTDALAWAQANPTWRPHGRKEAEA
jgi:hypothetical protein